MRTESQSFREDKAFVLASNHHPQNGVCGNLLIPATLDCQGTACGLRFIRSRAFFLCRHATVRSAYFTHHQSVGYSARAWKVDKTVGNVKNDSPMLIKPASATPEPAEDRGPEAPGSLLRYLVLRLLVTWTVAGDSAQVEVAGFQRPDAWAEMVISDRFADVELIDLYAMYLVSFHRHGLSSPSR
jgi:hypothetical protein